MNRRIFLKTAGIASLAIYTGTGFLSASDTGYPEISITIDDFNVQNCAILSGIDSNRAMIDALNNHSNLKAALFVTGKFLQEKNNIGLIKEWNEAGHIICNHTYSHFYYPKTDIENFKSDILKNDELLSGFSQFRKIFRFPYLKEGNTIEQRDKMRSFLKENGYKTGHVTVDASDWYICSRLRKRIEQNPDSDLSGYKKYYLEHILKRANYYNTLSKKVLGRSVKHTLLIHHNTLNGLYLEDLLKMFTENGWKLIDAEAAFNDKVFNMKPDILPAGESIIWSLAKAAGNFEDELRYPAEDEIYEKPLMDKLDL